MSGDNLCPVSRENCAELEKLQAQLDRSRVQLWRFALEKLSKETSNDTRGEAERLLEGVGFPFAFSHYTILFIKRIGTECSDGRNVDCWNGLHVTIREYFAERLSGRYKNFFFPHDGLVSAYIELPVAEDAPADECRAAERELFDFCSELTETFIRESGIKVRLALGDGEHGIENLPHLYARARSFADGVFLGEFTRSAFFYPDISKNIRGVAAGNRERGRLEKLVNTSVMSRDFSAASDALCRIIDMDCRAVFRCMYVKSQIIEHISKTYVIYELFPEESRGRLKGINTIKLNVLAAKTMQELKDIVCETFGNIDRYLSDEDGEDRISKVMRFVYENYSDQDMSVQKLADSFGLSLSYLSRRFREKTGEKIVDYISRCRVEAAKKLLIESRLSIPEVAHRVGYGNDLTFSRAFYRLEGITPGKFREK